MNIATPNQSFNLLISMDLWFSSQWIIVLFLLSLKLSHIWPVGAPSCWLLCPFDMPLFFKHFLLGTQNFSNLACTCLCSGISHFSTF